MIRQTAGIAIAEWSEEEPLRWVMRETVGEGKNASTKEISCDLTSLHGFYSRGFLQAIKHAFIARRTRIALHSVYDELGLTRQVLRRAGEHFARVCEEQSLPRIVFERIDTNLIRGVSAIRNELTVGGLVALKALYTFNRNNSEIFSPDLEKGDFPRKEAEGQTAAMRKSIIASAMSRSVLVQILNITEAAFENGTLDLAHYSFSRLMLSRAARPATYRLIRCKDLRIDNSGGITSYFLTLTIPKGRSAIRPKADVAIHREVGLLLEKQRESVAAQLKHLLRAKNSALDGDANGDLYTIGDLPMFPSPSTLLGTMLRKITQERLGMIRSSTQFIAEYVRPLQLLTNQNITCTAMRHTMGTQLAIAGCSAATIAAVLLHATNATAHVYTDLIFSGAIDELSDSMEEAFLEHFPVFTKFISIRDQIEPAKRILSESTDRERREITGACGRSRICEYAPITCYGCHLFIPAYDVDHSINLDVVNEEIQAAEVGGLQRQVDVKRYKHIANRIRIVIHVSDLKRASIEEQCTDTRVA